MSLLGRLYRGETDIDFIGLRNRWFVISGVTVLVCIILLATKGLTYGIEFEGGVQIQAPVAEDGPLGDASESEIISEVRSAVTPLGASDAVIQVVTDDGARTVSLQTKAVADPQRQQQVVTAVAEAVGTDVESTDSQRIGSKWGTEITGKALRALVIFLALVALFIGFRFEWKMSAAAMIALVHDLLITAGIYSLVGFEVTPATVIALLTILGYSLYDTVVVFDKVEENTALYATSGRMTYQSAANLSLNQVFMRSLNTSFMTLLPVAALLFVGAGLLGAETLKDLALALFVGLLTGAYSSIFVATPVLSVWKEHEQKYRNIREKLLRDQQRATLAPAAATTGGEDGGRTPVAVASRPGTSRPPAKPRAGSKKTKRRKRR